MTIPTELSTIFQSKQASYKMVLILSLVESIDNTGKASLNKVVENFIQYYKDREESGIIIEKEGSVINNLDSLKASRIRSLILENPYNALSSVLIKEGALPADEYIRFKPEIWAQLNDKSILELRTYALMSSRNTIPHYPHYSQYITLFNKSWINILLQRVSPLLSMN
jgi:5-methylcytosine-specific restriction protein B